MRGRVFDSKVEEGKLIIIMDFHGEIVRAEVSDPEVIDHLEGDCRDFLCGH